MIVSEELMFISLIQQRYADYDDADANSRDGQGALCEQFQPSTKK